MEVMEDGNLMDKVLILIQRDMEYYNSKQTVLQESICPGIVGGKLDFPRSASFAAVKLVLWWEEEFVAAFRRGSGFLKDVTDIETSLTTSGGCGGIVKASDPSKFINLIMKSSDELLNHLHVLTQEALDHADLTVLTGTIGAAALLKNCLWCYFQTANESAKAEADVLQRSQKKYQDMAEALAERLLDLHCRLLSLYILQDADSLDWENVKPFCEAERGSYVIQMWWLYMQGTKEDLWNTVPPKMAQRVFAGMLNESLTILTVRYSHALPSEKRSQLYTADISNLLLCVTKLLPSICNNAEEFVGLNLSCQDKMLRDVHAKCQELLICLLLRGSPLDTLLKVFRKGLDKIDIFKPKRIGPSPWILMTMPHLFADPYHSTKLMNNASIILELCVLLPQPQPNWQRLLKVVCMDNSKVAGLVLEMALEEYAIRAENHKSTPMLKSNCGGFLCSGDGDCKGVDVSSQFLNAQHYYDLIYAVTYVILTIGNDRDFYKILLQRITQQKEWYQCFDRRQVWNQKRPAWYEAILDLITPILPPIVETAINAVKTGASMYQVCVITLASFTQLWECANPVITSISNLIQDLLPSTIVPMGGSALLQFIISQTYTELLSASDLHKVRFADEEKSGPPDEALAVSEALCSIDEDSKHTDEIEKLLERAALCAENEVATDGCKRVEDSLQMLEVLSSDLLFTPQGKKSLKILHHFLRNNNEWLLTKLNGNPEPNCLPNIAIKKPTGLLHTMFYIGDKPFDQLLIGKWHLNWAEAFNIPMGLNVDRAYGQISSRWEFKDPAFVNSPNVATINYLNSVFKQSPSKTE